MLHSPNFRSMTPQWLPRGHVVLCSCALMGVILLSSGKLGAWQEELPSDLSESPIQSQRMFLPQALRDKQLTAEDQKNILSTVNDLLAPQIIDKLTTSDLAVPGGELVDPDVARVLQQLIDADDQLQLPRTVDVPLVETPLPEYATVEATGGLLTLVVRNASLGAVLNAVAEKMNLNIVSSGALTAQISITLNRVPLDDALDAILNVNGYRWVKQKNIIMVSSLSGGVALSPRVQGREVRVYQLNFVSAEDIDTTVQKLLSPIGTSSVTVIQADKLRTREELVVEDVPEYLARVDAYITQADRPPMQVLIEAHVLRVDLRDDDQHGVDLTVLARLASANISLSSNGMANPGASPAFLLNVDSTDLKALVEMIKSTTDAKTLAAPKVLVVNGQEARIQIGERLGYLTTTTTQTSTLQDVQFMDLGVVLTVTPVISRDGQILMTVKPEISSGSINPATGVPDAETTDVETTVLLPNGQGMVIGGLIQEENRDQQTKIPYVGDIPGFGRLFQRRVKVKERSEIIITLLPRIVPYNDPLAQSENSAQFQRAHAPLVYGPLLEVDRRRLEPSLPTATGTFCPPGQRIDCFPTPPVANSPYSSALRNPLPYLPPRSAPSAVPPREFAPVPRPYEEEQFLPPVTGQMSPRRVPIRQSSEIRPVGWHRAGSMQ